MFSQTFVDGVIISYLFMTPHHYQYRENIFSRNSEANASEFLEYLSEIFLTNNIHIVIYNKLRISQFHS